MIRPVAALGCGLLVLAAVLAVAFPGSHPRPALQHRAATDEFGIRELYPTRADATIWSSHWQGSRTFDGVDPDDPWFDAAHGSGRFAVHGGELWISGRAPRMYVHDPQERKQWRDVEVTVYAMRVRDRGVPFAGVTAVARSNHLRTEDGPSDLCDTRGYGARLRFDGSADFEKETAHPHNEAAASTEVFPGGLPRDVWVGMKFVVRDQPHGVRLELWLDRTDGRDGGSWRLVTSLVDDGHLFGSVPCAPGVDPEMELRAAPTRRGSESGLPNLSVYFRSDGIGADGLRYKWASVREIEPTGGD